MNKGNDMSKNIAWKHYAWLCLWWFCLYYGIIKHSIGASLSFLVVFFLANTYETLYKSIIIGVICAIVAVIPFVNIIFMIIGLICILFRINFLIKHWRVLLVGIYSYGVHFFLLLSNSLRSVLRNIQNAVYGADMSGIETAQTVANTVSDTVMIVGIIVATILAIVLHKLISWLYTHGYSTERAFLIMGLTPLIVAATVFPFVSHLKIGGFDLTGDSFLDADSIADASSSLTGIETGFMGTAAHGTHTLASEKIKREKENQQNN